MAKLYGTLSAPVWGTEDETGIIVDNIDNDNKSDNEELDNGQGDYVHTAIHHEKTDFTMDFTIKEAGYPTAGLVGYTITIENNGTDNDGTYIVLGVRLGRAKVGWKAGSLTAVKYPLDFTSGTTTTTTTT